MRLVAALMVAAALTACAATQYKLAPGQSQEQFVRDKQLCALQSRTAALRVTGLAAAILANNVFEDCMKDLGYARAD